MGPQFLIDNNLPPALVGWLKHYDREAFHVREVGLAQASDDDVWAYAQNKNLSIITKDRDFDQRALMARVQAAPVFRLVIGNATNEQLFTWLESRLALLGGNGFASQLRPDLALMQLVVIE